MSAITPTPGPWQIHSDYTLEGRTTVIANVDGEIIDGTTHYTFDFVCDTLGDDDSRSASVAVANAHLIAAAPDLLEALENLERYLRDTAHHNAVEAAAARAAIAKAHGEDR